MKIAFISYYYHPFIEGGSGVYANCIVENLAKNGMEMHVFTLKAPRKKQSNIIVHDIPFINKKFFSILTYYNNLKKEYSKIEKKLDGFDVLHENDLFGYPLAKIKKKTPRVVTIHHINKIEAEKAGYLYRIKNLRNEIGYGLKWEKDVIQRADKIIAVSEFTKNEIITAYKINEKKIKVIYNGTFNKNIKFSQEELEQFKNKLRIPKDFGIILFVGNIIARKNIDMLLRAFKEIKYRKSILIIAGFGDFSQYSRLSEKLEVQNRMIFTGKVNNIDLQKLYNICDLFVLPSKLEGFGIVLVEAMVAGKPIVATNVGGIPEVVKDKRNGLLVEVNDKEKLAEAMDYFLENPDIASKVGNYNRKYVNERFSWEKNAKETVEVYRSLIR